MPKEEKDIQVSNGSLKALYHHLLCEFNSERERSARIDNKLNFILVYLGTLLISTQFLIPDNYCPSEKRVALIIFIILMYLSILSDLVLIFYGLSYRKGKTSIDLDMFNENVIQQYKCSKQEDVYENHILEIKDCTKSYNSDNQRRTLVANYAIFIAFIATIFMTVALLLLIVWR